jgi:hypothetical protein
VFRGAGGLRPGAGIPEEAGPHRVRQEIGPAGRMATAEPWPPDRRAGLGRAPSVRTGPRTERRGPHRAAGPFPPSSFRSGRRCASAQPPGLGPFARIYIFRYRKAGSGLDPNREALAGRSTPGSGAAVARAYVPRSGAAPWSDPRSGASAPIRRIDPAGARSPRSVGALADGGPTAPRGCPPRRPSEGPAVSDGRSPRAAGSATARGMGRGPTGPSLGAAAPLGGVRPRATRRHVRGSPALASIRNAPPPHGPWAMPSRPTPARPRGRPRPAGAHRPGSRPHAGGTGPTGAHRPRSPPPIAEGPSRSGLGPRPRPSERGRRLVPPRARAAPWPLPLRPRWPTGAAPLPARCREAGRGPGRALQVERNTPGAAVPGAASELSDPPDASPGPLGGGGCVSPPRPARPAGPHARVSVGRETPTFLKP